MDEYLTDLLKDYSCAYVFGEGHNRFDSKIESYVNETLSDVSKIKNTDNYLITSGYLNKYKVLLVVTKSSEYFLFCLKRQLFDVINHLLFNISNYKIKPPSTVKFMKSITKRLSKAFPNTANSDWEDGIYNPRYFTDKGLIYLYDQSLNIDSMKNNRIEEMTYIKKCFLEGGVRLTNLLTQKTRLDKIEVFKYEYFKYELIYVFKNDQLKSVFGPVDDAESIYLTMRKKINRGNLNIRTSTDVSKA
jgi:hypothetical protein